MRYAVGIDYDGSRYRGWQTQQPGVPSVQFTLEKALARIAAHPVVLHAAGRTDAGVHAAGMIAHFDSDAQRSLYNWVLGTNTQLPPDIALRWITPVSDEFHARFKAVARRYRYVLLNTQQRSSQLAGKATWHYHPLSLAPMQQAVSYLVGRHDFTSFRAVGCQSRQPVRDVHFARLSQRGQLIVLDIQADGFLHHMVRNIIGVLLAIGQGKREPEWVQDLLLCKDRTQGGLTAPPDGLYFVDALYPPQFELPREPLGPLWLPDLSA